MNERIEPFLTHTHTDASNFRLRDAINKVEDLLDYCLELNLEGVVITDHEALSSHVKAHKYINKNKDKFKDFKLGFGNEIYLVDKEEVEKEKEVQGKIQFYHFILIAKNQNGYEGLKKLSSKAWSNSFFYKGVERVPTYKTDLFEIMKEYKGDIIATSACVGGEVPQLLIEFYRNPIEENRKRVNDLIIFMKETFGEDFYLELQPSRNEDQLIANKMLEKIGKEYNIKNIVSTDAHYLNPEQAKAHEIYLTASQGDREVKEFYATTYVMNYQELNEYFDEELLNEMVLNTHEIKDKLEPISFKQETKIPKAHIPEFELSKLFEPFYDKYEYIKKYSESNYEVDRFYLHLIAEGIMEKREALNEENLSRINLELNEIYHITKDMNQPLSSYFVLTKELIDIMWKVSLVGVSRGSASCYYTNYLLNIVQINPIKYNLPHWRFLTRERPELPDIDIDAESSKREEIIRLTKEEYGEENVLNMGTFTTEGTRSAVITACRGLGIDRDVSNNLANLIPTTKGGIWSLKECFYGDKEEGKKPVKNFIDQVNKYEGLKDALLSIEGVISGRSQHASGVIVFQDGFIKQNAMMKTTRGLPVTQFDAGDSEYMGGLKLDYLSINALDRIRAAMDLLLEYNKIEWQGSLRATYDKYFHPDVLEMNDPKMFEMLFDGHVMNAFQFETNVGQQALNKLNARTFDEIVAANSLMRLSGDGEQPLDKFIKHKEDISLWYKEMEDFGLTKEEIKIMEARSAETYGITDSQEGLMELFMDENISGLGLREANTFRKAIAKQNQEELKNQKNIFYTSGFENNTRKELLDYVWETQFKPSFGYSFSRPHTAGYTLILMIEMNICFRFGPIFWKTACLSINSGLIGDNETGANYGAIAKAVGDMKGIILNPDINLSKNGFTPLEEEDKILFGLKPIPGLGSDVVDAVIENRPYSSFNDFYEKLVASKIISERKAVQLIKAGCFDSFEKDRRQLMIDYVKTITPEREKLTMAQFPIVRHIIDEEKYKKELDLYSFRMSCFGRNKIPMNEELEKEFISKYSKEEIKYSFEKGKLVINEKDFNKFYQKSIDPLKKWINTKEALEEFRRVKMREFWKADCMGSIEAWEMETILFYSNKHELDYMPLDRNFNIVNFNDLPEEPVITGYKTYRNRKYPQFKIDTIAGTVVEKNKGKKLVYILTQDGVVTVRYSKGQYNYYDKKVVRVKGKEKEVLDESWFQRGTKLILVGFRREEEFVLRKTGTMYNHTTVKIKGFNKDQLSLQTEKIEE